jgi:hypothetical protein
VQAEIVLWQYLCYLRGQQQQASDMISCVAAYPMQVLQEALDNEDDARHAPTVDQLGPEAAVLLEELRERQVCCDL